MRKKSNKEKFTKEIRIMVQPSLFEKFEKACDERGMTFSEVLRLYMMMFIQDNNVFQFLKLPEMREAIIKGDQIEKRQMEIDKLNGRMNDLKKEIDSIKNQD